MTETTIVKTRVKPPKALARGIMVDCAEGKPYEFSVVGMDPEEVVTVLLVFTERIFAQHVSNMQDLLKAAHEHGIAVGKQQAASATPHALPVPDATAA